ncbi:MAG: NAD(P)H-dependent oxidoreductase [Gracilibacteraceae bacterium]|jgi:putative NADPH-quinone reductase|nr:NAD(P)H-dependent oxidoreductase [Gracilibacteraceae bacterium]
MITIIYAHPLEEGISAAARNALTEHLRAIGRPYTLINLHQDGFDPVMTAADRQTFFKGDGKSNYPLARKYQNILKETGHLVFIFPIWFNEQPAIVKGFFERVCLPGFGYGYAENGTAPLLTHIKKLTVLTASGAPTEMLVNVFDNMIEKQFIRHIVQTMLGPLPDEGAAAWINIGPALPEGLPAHIAKIKARFSA